MSTVPSAVVKRPLPASRKLTLWPLVASTYLMVSGGPYGLEDLVSKTGYAAAMVILILTPLVWSLPTALMVSELSSAIPENGGFYVWVRRGLGRFWGFQEVWLTLIGSIFEMALYPTLFVEYLGHFMPVLASGHTPLFLGLGVIVVCTLWNILGTKAVGQGSAVIASLLLAPFVVLVFCALLRTSPPGADTPEVGRIDLLGGILIAMWNYMGWDNVSTIAGDVDRPQRTYPRAMLYAVMLVTVGYLVPVAAVWRTGLDPNAWSTGGWVDVAQYVGGTGLAAAIMLAGAAGSLGTFNALMLSFSQLPVVMSQDGFLPRMFARRHPRTSAPWVAIVALGLGWAAALNLGFERLVMLNVLLTGLSIQLEFWALVALRIREPGLTRPYRIPGGTWACAAIGIPPLVLIIMSAIRNSAEQAGPMSALTLGFLLIAAGPIVYALRGYARRRDQ